MKTYYPRNLETLLNQYLKGFPVVGITGPRQSGKSTLLQQLLGKTYQYITFDDYRMVEFFYEDPNKFMETYSDKVIFDEVQKVPEIFNYIKIAVDNDRQNYGKFILTGSSQFAFIRKITESLAGRIGLLTLLPFEYSELPKNVKRDALYEGAYPELINRQYALKDEWYASYLETYIEKDVRQVYDIGNIRDFRRLILLLAANVGSILNMSRFANDLGVAVSTIKKWISVLEASYMVFLLPAYTQNARKSIVKSPKIYFIDNGLVTYLCGISTRELFERGPMGGALFENYIVSEVHKRMINVPRFNFLYYYKEQRGLEIDLIIDDFQNRMLIEIKSNSTFRPKMVAPIETFLKDGDHGFLVYRGENFPYKPPIHILNYEHFLEKILKKSLDPLKKHADEGG